MLRRRFAHAHYKKTDDELTRYLKQTKLIQQRQHFEQELEEETLARKNKMNTLEIWQNHETAMRAHEYDRNRANDRLSWSFLTDKKIYRPLG